MSNTYLACSQLILVGLKQTGASNIGYGAIFKQINLESNKNVLVCFTFGKLNAPQFNYSTIKKEILSITKCLHKFQDFLDQKFLIRIDCSFRKSIIEKHIKNLTSKQMFAMWQAKLSFYNFTIDYIRRDNNSLVNFLTREFLQGKDEKS